MAHMALSRAQASSPRDVSTYRLLGSLGSHDLSAMRELLGMPKRCIAATRAQGDGPPFITALFEYGNFTCTYETGIDDVADFDAHIEVIGRNKRVKIRYDTVRPSLSSPSSPPFPPLGRLDTARRPRSSSRARSECAQS